MSAWIDAFFVAPAGLPTLGGMEKIVRRNGAGEAVALAFRLQRTP